MSPDIQLEPTGTEVQLGECVACLLFVKSLSQGLFPRESRLILIVCMVTRVYRWGTAA